jgi:ABC-type glycerol-3-phosphate transport system permease component
LGVNFVTLFVSILAAFAIADRIFPKGRTGWQYFAVYMVITVLCASALQIALVKPLQNRAARKENCG